MNQKSLSDEFNPDTQPDFIPKWLKVRSPKELLWMVTVLFWSTEFVLLLVEFFEKL